MEGVAQVEVVRKDGYMSMNMNTNLRMNENCGKVSHMPLVVVSATMLSPREHCFNDEIVAAFR